MTRNNNDTIKGIGTSDLDIADTPVVMFDEAWARGVVNLTYTRTGGPVVQITTLADDTGSYGDFDCTVTGTAQVTG